MVQPEGTVFGKRIGPYEILEEIGRGGMATVYKAYHRELKRTVAVKVLASHLVRRPAFIQRFVREARAAAQLNHPNIVTVYGAARQGDVYLYSMEYVEGKSLYETIEEQGELPARRALEITRQVAEALKHAHEHEIVHRDVTPQNIILLESGDAKVLDFGLARVLNRTSEVTVTGANLGTPAYMSPEQCQGRRADGRSDVYSLGVVLYQMVTGRLPVDPGDPIAVMYNIVHGPFRGFGDAARQAPKPVQRLVAEMLVKDPAQRPTSAELCERIDTVLQQMSESGRGQWLLSGVDRIRRAVATRWRLCVALAALAMVVLAIAGITYIVLPPAGEGSSPATSTPEPKPLHGSRQDDGLAGTWVGRFAEENAPLLLAVSRTQQTVEGWNMMTFEDGDVTWHFDNVPIGGKYVVRDDTNPRQIDIKLSNSVSDLPGFTWTFAGIFEVNGDNARFAFGQPGPLAKLSEKMPTDPVEMIGPLIASMQERPRSFKKGAGALSFTVTRQREKANGTSGTQQ